MFLGVGKVLNGEHFYEELGWESLSERRWSRRMTMFYKILDGMAPSYLSDHLPENTSSNYYSRKNTEHFPEHLDMKIVFSLLY